MAKNDRIGYVGTYPLLGVPAAINAFALGAQLTNPRARISLRWTCQPGNPTQELISEGIRVISNRDIPTPGGFYLHAGGYGTYLVEDSGRLTALASPCYLWGRFYENVIRSILSGAWDQERDASKAVNYWWGLNSGVIDVKLADSIPPGAGGAGANAPQGPEAGGHRPLCQDHPGPKRQGHAHGGPGILLPGHPAADGLALRKCGRRNPRLCTHCPHGPALVRELGVHREQVPLEKEEGL